MHDEASAGDSGILLSNPDFDSLRRRMEQKAALGQLGKGLHYNKMFKLNYEVLLFI